MRADRPRFSGGNPLTKARACTTGERRELLSNLYELIEALDRRVPRLERVGEATIAQEAGDLRERALTLIHRIEADAPME